MAGISTISEDDISELGLLTEDSIPAADRPWKLWTVGSSCLLFGFISGALFHNDAVSRAVGAHTHAMSGTSHASVLEEAFRTSTPLPSTTFHTDIHAFHVAQDIQKTFWPDPSFAQELANETDAAWEALMPCKQAHLFPYRTYPSLPQAMNIVERR